MSFPKRRLIFERRHEAVEVEAVWTAVYQRDRVPPVKSSVGCNQVAQKHRCSRGKREERQGKKELPLLIIKEEKERGFKELGVGGKNYKLCWLWVWLANGVRVKAAKKKDDRQELKEKSWRGYSYKKRREKGKRGEAQTQLDPRV